MSFPRSFSGWLVLLVSVLATVAARADLIGYWDFPSSASLGQDESPYGNTLAVSGSGVTWTSNGKVNGGLALTGSGCLATTGSIAGLPVGNSAYTVAAWIKPTSTSTNNALGIVGWGNYGATRQVNALRTNGTNGFSHYWWSADLVPTDAQVTAAGVTISDTWVHVAASFDGATRSIYLNGQLLVSDSPGVNGSLNKNFAVGRTVPGSEYFKGTLDEVAIWNTALPAAEIAALAAGTATPLSGPRITSFASTVTSAFEGNPVPLSWTVNATKDTGALNVTLTQGSTTLYSGAAASGNFTATVPALNGVAQTLVYTLTATDAGSNATTSATVSVNALPDVPTATPQSGLTVTAPNTLPVTLAGTDPANTALTYAIVTPPAHGTLSALSGSACTYTPASGYAGMDSFSFKTNNRKYDSAAALVSLAVITTNAAPTAITLSNSQVNASLASGAFVGNFASADPNAGEPHAYTLVSGTGGTDNARFAISGHQLRTAQSFAGLIGNTCQIRVRSTNAASLYAEQTFTLAVAAAPAGGVVINEILYNGQSNAIHDDFVELYNNTGSTVDLSGWQLTKAVSCTFPAGTTLPAGGYLVIAEDPTVIQSIWGVTALAYSGNLSSDGETLNLVNAAGTKVCEVDYTPRFPYPLGANGNGGSMELINPSLDPSLGGSWRSSIFPADSSAVDVASPGKQNLQYAANAAPAVRNVTATPTQPAAGVPVVISAKVTDPDGVKSVQLQYQLVAPGNFVPATLPNPIVNHLIVGADSPLPANPAFEAAANWVTVPMNDDGLNGDAQGGDDVYSATLPGQPNRTLVRYRLVVTDNVGSAVRTPYVDDDSRNFACFVYNGVPAYQGTPAATLTLLPNYHFLTRLADYNQCVAYDSASQVARNTSSWTYENWEAAVVYNGTVYDHVLYRLHGANGRYYYNSKRAWRWAFNKGYEFQASDNDGKAFAEPWRHLVTENLWENRGTLTYSLNENLNFYLWKQIGIPSPNAAMINFRLLDNAQEQPDAWHGDYWGLMFVHEDYEKNFLDAHNLAKGNLYKLTSDNVSGVSQQRYQAPDAVTDGSDHDTIYTQLNGFSTPAFVTAHVNLAEWNLYHALAEAVRHYDYWPSGDNNGAYYFDPATYTTANNGLGQLWIMPSDTDATWGPTWNAGHDVVHNALFNDSADLGGDTGTNPTLWAAYFNEIREVRDLLWQPDQINPLVDQFAAIILPQEAADSARWKNAPADAGNYNGLGGAGATSIANLVQDMKNFAFVGGQWPGDTSAIAGRGAYLDMLQLGVSNSEAAMPGTPTITYRGSASYPINNLTFQTSAFAGQGGNTFAAIQWRVAEITDPAAPAYVAGSQQLLEWNASYDSGSVTTFAGQFRFPASACQAGHTYRARVRHLDSAGRWSHWSAAAQFTATAANVTGYQNSLVVSELMYYAATPTAAETAAGYKADDFQFLEIRNVSSAPVDLTDVSITKGVTFSFPSGLTLAGGASTVVVANAAAFAERYGSGRSVAGSWQASGESLAHKGEEIKLSYGGTQTIIDFTYSNTTPWPVIASGSGYSLVLIQPATLPDPTNAANWRRSYYVGGNPGGSDGSTYAAWAAAYPGTASNPTGDPDGDGIDNLLEYALGGNPNNPARGILPQAGVQALTVNGLAANYLTLSFNRLSDADDLTYHVEFSSNMVTWSETGVLVSSVSNGAGMFAQVWRAPNPVTASPAFFARVRVTTP